MVVTEMEWSNRFPTFPFYWNSCLVLNLELRFWVGIIQCPFLMVNKFCYFIHYKHFLDTITDLYTNLLTRHEYDTSVGWVRHSRTNPHMQWNAVLDKALLGCWLPSSKLACWSLIGLNVLGSIILAHYTSQLGLNQTPRFQFKKCMD